MSTRRGLLGGAAAASLTVTCGATASPANPDAELIALCVKFEADDRASTARYVADDSWEGHHRGVAERLDLEKVLLVIAKMPARTPAGLAAKARLVQRGVSAQWDADPLDADSDGWEHVTVSLSRDAISLGAGA